MQQANSSQAAIKKIAERFAVSENELGELDWVIVPDENKEGMLYGYWINFSEDSNPYTLRTLGVDEDNSLYVEPSFFDEPEDYYFDELEWELESETHYTDFRKSIDSVESLLSVSIPDSNKFSFHVMVFMHVVSSLEHLFYRTFLHEVTTSDVYAQRLIKTDPQLSGRKFSLGDLTQTQNNLDGIISKHIKEIIFHNIGRIVPMYKDVFGYDFGDTTWIADAVSKRHDCAHRAGHRKDGTPIDIVDTEIATLIQNCRDICRSIEAHLASD